MHEFHIKATLPFIWDWNQVDYLLYLFLEFPE